MKKIIITLFISSAIFAQTAYTDNFTTQPFSGYPTSFTTGTPTVGLSYSATNGDFAWASDYGEVNIFGPVGESASFTITSRDGKAFYFNSIKLEAGGSGGGVKITGSGYQPFTIDISAGSAYTNYSPSGGAKLVTQITIASVAPHDFVVFFDDVSTTLGYSVITFADGSSFTQSITPNNANQVIGRFLLDADLGGADLTAATIHFEGTPIGISNFKLWASSDASFGGDTQLGSTIANYPGNGNSITFNGFSNAINAAGNYYFISADISASPSGTVRAYLVSNANLTLSGNGFLNVTISNAYLSSEASPLPVELTSFTASTVENKVVLNWQTATEVNNYGFEVQRSVVSGQRAVASGQLSAWETIGFVDGNGNSNSVKEYSFSDDISQLLSHYLNHSLTLPKELTLSYRLKQIDNDGSFSYSDEIIVETLHVTSLPTEYTLEQNYPNPFNPSTTIKFGLPKDSKVVLEVFNIIGEKVTTLINGEMQAGIHNYQFSIDNYQLSSGIYIYKLSTDDFTSTKKFVLMK